MLGAGSVTGLDIDPQVVYINQLFHLVAWCVCVSNSIFCVLSDA